MDMTSERLILWGAQGEHLFPISYFLKDEDGAVTVDRVVLTAAIVGLGIAAISTVSGGVTGRGDRRPSTTTS
ncbi:MAG: hypothetical protein H5U15_07275 [Roseovarius sp.]|nr:hypothetical protein [Roseovarius sp.]